MLSQLPELQPAIPSSFLGISQAAAASGAGGNILAEVEERGGIKLRDPPRGVMKTRWLSRREDGRTVKAAGWMQTCSILGCSLREKGQLGFFKGSLELRFSPQELEMW